MPALTAYSLIFNDYTNTTDGVLVTADNGTTGTGLTSNYNLWNSTNRQILHFQSTDYSTLAGWQTRTGQDANSITANPLFTNAAIDDFRPVSTSPACTASSNGSYIGAVPCASAAVIAANKYLFMGSYLMFVKSGIIGFY